MAKKESLITGVDIGSHAVKICQLQKTGKGYKVLAVGTAAIPAGAVEDGVLQDPEAVGKALAALLKNLRIKNHKIGISISGYSVIVKKISPTARSSFGQAPRPGTRWTCRRRTARRW